jgi:hypothetical protein
MEWLIAEVKKCKADFDYFCVKYLKIVDKKNKLVALTPKPTQARLINLLQTETTIYNLKARKMGSSTIIAAYFFWKTHFTPNLKTLVAAHTAEAAQEIFTIYSTFYEYLPIFFKIGQFELEKDNVKAMRYVHGGGVRVTTASSPSARGGTPHQLHLSEFAHYTNMDVTIGAIMASLPDGATIVKETTANGLNEAFGAWTVDDGTCKVFFPWMADPTYIRMTKPKRIPKDMNKYKKEHNLTRHQYYWACNAFFERCAGQWKLWNQEFPANAEIAFVSSGDRFFGVTFPQIRITKDNEDKYIGRREYLKPDKFAVYSLGADVASGSKNGDFSAYTLLDVTDREKPRLAATYYGRLPPEAFASLILVECKKYNALATVEVNSYGLSVVSFLLQEAWPYVYRRTHHNKLNGTTTHVAGFNTNRATRGVILSRLHSYIENGHLSVVADARIQDEVNQMMYIKGKPQAGDGGHDDIIIATALALEGMNQTAKLEEDVRTRLPETRHERLMWELKNQRIFNPKDFEDETHDLGPSDSVVDVMSNLL